jgi:succinate dehydrogenase/fumarate reductase flavoprotein subunit
MGNGAPIARLYAAGELGSMFGHLYLLAGNSAECFIGGRIAGRNAAAEAPWTE